MKNLVAAVIVCAGVVSDGIGMAAPGARGRNCCRATRVVKKCRAARRIPRRRCAACQCRSTSVGQSPSAKSPKAASEFMLFDGKTLEGWKHTNFGGEGEVSVRDGAIFMDYGADLTGIHRDWPTRRINYEVELEARRVEGTDFFVGLTFPVRDSYCSLILGGWGGGVCGISSIDGYDASENETTSYENFTLGKWYKVRLRVVENEIVAWVDDKELVRLDTEGRKLSVRFEVEPSQPFGLCAFQTQSAVRGVKARLVEADSPE